MPLSIKNEEKNSTSLIFDFHKVLKAHNSIATPPVRYILILMRPFLHKVYRLMSEKGLSYQEACKEIGRHGARRRASLRGKHPASWPLPQTAIKAHPDNSTHPHPQPPPAPEHHWEQTTLSFL